MKRFACLSFVLVAACGDDGTVATDAANIDAKEIDAQEIDAHITTYSGTITGLEVAVLNPGASGTIFGQGVQVGISFQDSDTAVAPTMEEQAGVPFGCKLFEYNRAQAIQSSVGNNEGPVQVTVTGAGAPAYPACIFTPNVGYTCPELPTMSTGGIIGPGPMAGLATLTDADTTFNGANSTGRYVNITGATNMSNNGAFPIVAVGGANTIVYANPGFVAETVPATGGHINLAAAGPIPSAPDPGFLANDAGMMFALTPGGGNHFTAFTATTGAANVGDDFDMPMAERIKLNAIPTNGAAFTVSCQDGNTNCNTAAGSLLNIVTTDGPLTPSPFSFPLPTTKRVQVRCATLGATSITVPAAYMAAIMNSGYTRIQATYMRPFLMTGGPATVNSLGGHAITGFTNRP